MRDLKPCPCPFCGQKTYPDLTIRQLKMMVGEPVFVVTDNKKEWCIVHSYHLPEVVGGGIIVTTRTSQKKTLPYLGWGVFWKAYDRKVDVVNA